MRARRSRATTPADTTEVISTLEALDRKLREVDDAFRISDDEMRKVFNLGLGMVAVVQPW